MKNMFLKIINWFKRSELEEKRKERELRKENSNYRNNINTTNSCSNKYNDEDYDDINCNRDEIHNHTYGRNREENSVLENTLTGMAIGAVGSYIYDTVKDTEIIENIKETFSDNDIKEDTANSYSYNYSEKQENTYLTDNKEEEEDDKEEEEDDEEEEDNDNDED